MATRDLIIENFDKSTVVHNRHVVLAWLERNPGVNSWYSGHAIGLYNKLVALIRAAVEEQSDGSIVAEFDCPDRVYSVGMRIVVPLVDNPDLYEIWARHKGRWRLENKVPVSAEDAGVFAPEPYQGLVQAPLEGYQIRNAVRLLTKDLKPSWPGTAQEYRRLRDILENTKVDPAGIATKIRYFMKTDYSGQGAAELIRFLDSVCSASSGNEFEYYLDKCNLTGNLIAALRVYYHEYQTWSVRAECTQALEDITRELKTFEVKDSASYVARSERLIEAMQKYTDKFREAEIPNHSPENWKYWL